MSGRSRKLNAVEKKIHQAILSVSDTVDQVLLFLTPFSLILGLLDDDAEAGRRCGTRTEAADRRHQLSSENCESLDILV